MKINNVVLFAKFLIDTLKTIKIMSIIQKPQK